MVLEKPLPLSLRLSFVFWMICSNISMSLPNSVEGVISFSSSEFSMTSSLLSDDSSFGGGTALKNDPDIGSSPSPSSLLSVDMARGNDARDNDDVRTNDESRRELELEAMKAPPTFVEAAVPEIYRTIDRAMILPR